MVDRTLKSNYYYYQLSASIAGSIIPLIVPILSLNKPAAENIVHWVSRLLFPSYNLLHGIQNIHMNFVAIGLRKNLSGKVSDGSYNSVGNNCFFVLYRQILKSFGECVRSVLESRWRSV